MSESTLEKVSKDFGRGFDEVRKELLGKKARLVILKQSGETVPFIEIYSVVSGWHARFSDRVGAVTISIADISQAFAIKLREVSAVVILDSDLPTTNNLLFEVAEDSIAPSVDHPFWRLEVNSTGRFYEAPKEE